MAYIGLPPKANFTSGLLDRFTSTTGTTVTLTHDISSENDIVVFVNFVKQDSTTYSVGGTGNKTLTLGGTLVSSDIVEVHYLNIVGQTVNPSANSVGSSQLTADVITGQTELASGVASTDELLISDAGTLKRVDVSLIGGANTPSFSAYAGSDQSGIADQTWTKIAMNTEFYDTDSAYDTSTYRFTVPSGKAGKYVFAMSMYMDASNTLEDMSVGFYKNGNLLFYKESAVDNRVDAQVYATIDLSAGDYVEPYIYMNVASGGTGTINQNTASNNRVYWYGFKLIT